MIWSAFVIGFLGSLHCVGMCGPLALAVPAIPGKRWQSAVLFNSGRILTYMLLGAFFGLVGYGFQLAGFQSYLSILTGIFVLTILFIPSIKNGLNNNGGNWLFKKVKAGFGKYLGSKSPSSIFTLGLLNGLLPCGLIYVAIAGALETGFVELAAVYMGLFGLGTSVLLMITFLSRGFVQKFHALKPRKMVPYLTFLIGILFIVRGALYMVPPSYHDLAAFEMLEKITMCHVR